MAEHSSSRMFPLRIAPSMHFDLERFAEREGLSLNQAILLAVTEELIRSEGGVTSSIEDPSSNRRSATVRVAKKDAT
jgi:hypothetical protein